MFPVMTTLVFPVGQINDSWAAPPSTQPGLKKCRKFGKCWCWNRTPTWWSNHWFLVLWVGKSDSNEGKASPSIKTHYPWTLKCVWDHIYFLICALLFFSCESPRVSNLGPDIFKKLQTNSKKASSCVLGYDDMHLHALWFLNHCAIVIVHPVFVFLWLQEKPQMAAQHAAGTCLLDTSDSTWSLTLRHPLTKFACLKFQGQGKPSNFMVHHDSWSFFPCHVWCPRFLDTPRQIWFYD